MALAPEISTNKAAILRLKVLESYSDRVCSLRHGGYGDFKSKINNPCLLLTIRNNKRRPPRSIHPLRRNNRHPTPPERRRYPNHNPPYRFSTFLTADNSIRGFAYIEYESAEDAEEAIYNMNDSELYSRVIKVDVAKPHRGLAGLDSSLPGTFSLRDVTNESVATGRMAQGECDERRRWLSPTRRNARSRSNILITNPQQVGKLASWVDGGKGVWVYRIGWRWIVAPCICRTRYK